MGKHLEIITIGLATCIIILLSFWPLYAISTTLPPDRVMIPIHNDLSDYLYYVSFIRQGMDGHLLTSDRYAVESHSPGIVHVFYLYVGHIGRLLGMSDAHWVYQAARLVLSILWHAVMYWCIRRFVQNRIERVSAYLLLLFTSSLPIISTTSGLWQISWHGLWWTELDPIRRAAFIPHFLAGHMLLVSLVLLTQSLRNSWHLARGALLAILSALSGLIHPPSFVWSVILSLFWMFTDMCTQIYTLGVHQHRVDVSGFLGDIRSVYRARIWHIALILLVLIVPGSIAVRVVMETLTQFPWNLSQQLSENEMYSIPFWESLAPSLGITLPLSVLGFLRTLKNPRTWVLALWGYSALGMFYLSPILAQRNQLFSQVSNIRYLQTVPWLSFAILASFMISHVYHRYGKKSLIFLVILYVVLTVPGYPTSLSIQASKRFGGPNLHTPTSGWYEAMRSISTFTSQGESMLSLPLAGLVNPTYNDRTSYTGMEVYNTPDIGHKMSWAWRFYNGQISECEAYTEMQKHNVGAVFYGYDEQASGNGPEQMRFLKLWKDFGGTRVYEVDLGQKKCY